MSDVISAEARGIFLRAVHDDFSEALSSGAVSDFQDYMDKLGISRDDPKKSMVAVKGILARRSPT